MIYAALIITIITAVWLSRPNLYGKLPKVAIASYGPHSSLQATIEGIEEGLAHHGLKKNQHITLEVMDVNFEPTLIMQMLAKLKASNPQVIVTLTTSISQAAKSSIKDIPVVFADVTDPIEAGLVQSNEHNEGNITGVAECPNLMLFMGFAKKLLPDAEKIGVLYSTGEANDAALVVMIQEAAKAFDMEVLAVPIENARDIAVRMQSFKDNVDFIYVVTSGPIQPSLPAIFAEADRMGIPVFNADEAAVKEHLALGSFGVSFYQIGINTANIIVQILQGEMPDSIPISYPAPEDHQGFISQKKAAKLGIHIPTGLENVTIVAR